MTGWPMPASGHGTAPHRAAPRRAALQFIAAASKDVVLKTVAAELQRGLQGLLGQPVPVVAKVATTAAKRDILLFVEPSRNVTGGLKSQEGFRIFSQSKDLMVASKSSVGILYGVFHLKNQPIYSFYPWRAAESQKSCAYPAGKRFISNWQWPPHYRDSS